MKEERKSVVVLVDANPIVVTLSNEVRTIKKVELVYFKLMKLDMARVPINLYLRLDQTQSVRSDQIVASNNIASTVASGYSRLRSDTVPLHFKLGNVYQDNLGAYQQNKCIFGIQPEGMRWRANDVAAMTCFQVTLVNFDGNPYDFGSTGTTMELVFDVKWAPSQLQSKEWRTDRVYMNSMNG